jgi:hypothetical protein
MKLKRRNDKDITNQWQNCKYFIFSLYPSEGPQPGATQEGGEISNLLHESFPKLEAPLTVVLVCFVHGIGTYL